MRRNTFRIDKLFGDGEHIEVLTISVGDFRKDQDMQGEIEGEKMLEMG